MALEDLINDKIASDAEDKAAKEKKTFNPKGGNSAFYDSEVVDYAAILSNVESLVRRDLRSAGAAYGWNPYVMDQFFDGNWVTNGALGFIDSILSDAENQYQSLIQSGIPPELVKTFGGAAGQGALYYQVDPKGINELVDKVWGWYGQRAPFDLDAGLQASGSSGRGSSGSRAPTAEEIRNGYDLDQLADAATEIWRGNLLEEPGDARGLARSYVDLMVSSGGQKAIDFTTFVRNQAKKTPRHASVYRNKPESVSDEAYIGRYFQSAMQVLRPANADEVAIRGAQLGADSQSFAANLRKQDEVTGSADFINELGSRIKGVSSVLRG